jgi:hypothetical protein
LFALLLFLASCASAAILARDRSRWLASCTHGPSRWVVVIPKTFKWKDGCPTFAKAYVGRKRGAKPHHCFHPSSKQFPTKPPFPTTDGQEDAGRSETYHSYRRISPSRNDGMFLQFQCKSDAFSRTTECFFRVIPADIEFRVMRRHG